MHQIEFLPLKEIESRNDSLPFQEGMENLRHRFLHRCCSSVFSSPAFAQRDRLPRKSLGAGTWLVIDLDHN